MRCKRGEEAGEGDQAECNSDAGKELARRRLLLGALGQVFNGHGAPAPGNILERIHWKVSGCAGNELGGSFAYLEFLLERECLK